MKLPLPLTILTVLLALLFAPTAKADTAFAKQTNVDALRYMSLQHNQTIKTFDTYSRDLIFHITGKSKFDGMNAAQAVLDMAFNPQEYLNRNVVYVRNKPFRLDFEQLSFISEIEKKRIKEEGTISLAFWQRPETQQAMDKIVATSSVKLAAVNEIHGQVGMLALILDYDKFRQTLFHQAIVPAEDSKYPNEKPWETLPNAAGHLLQHSEGHSAAYIGGIEKMALAVEALSQGWRAKDAVIVGRAATDLAAAAESINPSAYPSLTKRKVEVAYNSLSRLTWPAAALYFIGFIMFLIAWRTELKWAYVVAWGVVLIGWLAHVAAIGVRWWLVEKSVGNWFESIPIKNQFESVMFSAWFGAVVALVLETGVITWLLKRIFGWNFGTLAGQGIFGAAGAFIGMLSLISLFAVPFVTGHDNIGAGIKQNAGILMTYWLYIHVTLVTASYALIGMTFVLGVWYCIAYFRFSGYRPPLRGIGIVSIATNFIVDWLAYSRSREERISESGRSTLQTLDSANLTMLQLAFWILGIGIITGALWADVSWGRPWGWDPKETFALITWIVYLIIVHIRFVTAGTNRAIITSVLSVVGFFVMLFNWIGVNFFLVGLHSYA